MKSLLKKIVSPLTLAAAVVVASVQPVPAADWTAKTLLGGASYATNVFAMTTNTYNSESFRIDCREASFVAVQVYGRNIVSNCASLRLDFRTSANNVSPVFSNTNLITVARPGLSTNGVSDLGTWCYNTNIDVRGFGWLQLYQVANTDPHGGATNFIVTASALR